MVNDNLSQIIKYTIEKIEKVPPETISKLLSKLLEERETLVRILEEGIRKPVVLLSENMDIVYFNREAVKKKIISESEEKPIFSNEFQGIVKRIFDNISKTDIIEFTNKFTVKTKDPVVKSITKESIFKIFSSKLQKTRETLMIFEDITEEESKFLDKEQDETIKTLFNLASNLAHEIKNPLFAIQLHANVIKRKIPKNINNKQIIEEVEIVLSEINRLKNIVDNFLTGIRPYKVFERYENLENIIAEVAEVFKYELFEKQIKLSIHIDENIPSVPCDRDTIKQMLINLIKNSIEAIKDKNGKIEISLSTYYKDYEDYVIINVKDNGIGIPKELSSKIFEPYFSTKEQGTGLGLSIVYKIVKAHNGFIEIDSEENKGTSVKIYLPYKSTLKELPKTT